MLYVCTLIIDLNAGPEGLVVETFTEEMGKMVLMRVVLHCGMLRRGHFFFAGVCVCIGLLAVSCACVDEKHEIYSCTHHTHTN